MVTKGRKKWTKENCAQWMKNLFNDDWYDTNEEAIEYMNNPFKWWIWEELAQSFSWNYEICEEERQLWIEEVKRNESEVKN